MTGSDDKDKAGSETQISSQKTMIEFAAKIALERNPSKVFRSTKQKGIQPQRNRIMAKFPDEAFYNVAFGDDRVVQRLLFYSETWENDEEAC